MEMKSLTEHLKFVLSAVVVVLVYLVIAIPLSRGRSIFSSRNLKYFSSIFDRQLKLRLSEWRAPKEESYTHCNAKGNATKHTHTHRDIHTHTESPSARTSWLWLLGHSLCFRCAKCEKRMRRTTNEMLGPFHSTAHSLVAQLPVCVCVSMPCLLSDCRVYSAFHIP